MALATWRNAMSFPQGFLGDLDFHLTIAQRCRRSICLGLRVHREPVYSLSEQHSAFSLPQASHGFVRDAAQQGLYRHRKPGDEQPDALRPPSRSRCYRNGDWHRR